jgi:hypothetical protein
LPDSHLEGNLRAYVYAHPDTGGIGYGFSFDQSIGNALQTFARWTRNSDRPADWFGIRQAWSIGARHVWNIPRHRTIFALAFGRVHPAAKTMGTESVFEAYVRYRMNTWSYVSPHLQHYFDAAGSNRNYTLISLRTQFNF